MSAAVVLGPSDGPLQAGPIPPVGSAGVPAGRGAVILQLAWRAFICRACGLIYDEAQGDADSGLAPGTRFEDIPDDWACPLCGVSKADFEPYEAESVSRRAAAPTSAARSHAARHDAGVVIVGAGRAGWQMAQALRDRDSAMPITIVTACSGDVYDKPMLSVALAKGVAPAALVKEAARDAAARLGVRLMPHTDAIGISASAPAGASSWLRTTRGTLRFRHLVLAHGAAPREIATLPPALCWRVNHLDAYRALRTQLDAAHAGGGARVARVVITGAGLVGCELANDLALAGYAVTLLEVGTRPLQTLLSEADSNDLLAAWRDLPLTFVGGQRITGVTQQGAVRTVHTDGGGRFDAEQVVAATGLQTPSRLAQSAGLAFDNGIAVEADSLRTSVARIHALGDCISIGGRPMRYIEPIARQAKAIAATITGDAAVPYDRSAPPVRIKTTSRPFTVAAAACGP